MKISESTIVYLIAAICLIVIFVYSCIRKQEIKLIHKLYISFACVTVLWFIVLIPVCVVDPSNTKILWALDCGTYAGAAFTSPVSLLIALAFVKGSEKIPRSWYAFLIIPVITNIIAWTNPWHHLMYKTFSVVNTEVVFGNYMIVNGAYSYFCTLGSAFIMLKFAFSSSSRLYIRQAILFSVGSLIPTIVNALGVLKIIHLSMIGTPIAFLATILLHGFAIFHFHMLDIKPIALEHVLEWMSDCFVVVSESGLVVNYNKSFNTLFGKTYGIEENAYLNNCLKTENIEGKAVIYNLMTAIEQCRQTLSHISYEQAIVLSNCNEVQKRYYVVEVAPLVIENEKLAGFLAYLKDVTKVKESMQRLQDSNERMMEQERLASLGQMVGGIAHNLKTPIMSISGSIFAEENLVQECIDSLGDEEVTVDDYREIYEEMNSWLSKMREACSYMSDIITAVKEQAVNMNTSEKLHFSVKETLKRVSLLMRHELTSSGCTVVIDDRISEEAWLSGDVNNLVQVINNLITNAAFSMNRTGGGEIRIEIDKDNDNFILRVRDRGEGVSSSVRDKLFKQMITNKGAQGTGLGLYISNSVIRGKFFGEMWVEDNPGGGAVFGISIPLEYVLFRDADWKEVDIS